MRIGSPFEKVQMATIGKRNQLAIIRYAPPGLYLDGGESGEILLPRRYVPSKFSVGDYLEVFVYLDSEDRLVATTEVPLCSVGEFACLSVVSINQRVGAFLNWGLSKDLLLPFREQEKPVRPGDKAVVFVLLDEKTERIVATTRLSRHFSRETPPYKQGEQVQLMVLDRTPLGYNAVVENAHRGLLYHDKLSVPLQPGQRLKGFIRNLRPGGKIDLSLDASGYKRVATLTDRILEKLKQNGGKLPFDDSSAPELIRQSFGVSKKAFKQALGFLYKQRRINLHRPGISLNENNTFSPGR